MLSYEEYSQLSDDADKLDAQFTDEVFDKGEFYDVQLNDATGEATVVVYDENGTILATAKVTSAENAIAYMEEIFDLEPIESDEDIDPASLAQSTPFGGGN